MDYYSLTLWVFDFYMSILGWDTKVHLGFKGSPKSESSSTSLDFFGLRIMCLITHHDKSWTMRYPASVLEGIPRA